MTDNTNETFEVVTIRDTKKYPNAGDTVYVHNRNSPSFLEVKGVNGDVIRTFNLDHVVDYGWEMQT